MRRFADGLQTGTIDNLTRSLIRRGGRAVEGTGLENRQRLTSLVGSNPTPSARNSLDLRDFLKLAGSRLKLEFLS
jgi:hypothetical protein